MSELTDSEIPVDIRQRIEKDFGTGATRGILPILAPILEGKEPWRVVRAVIFLSEGDVEKLRHNVHQAVMDYRDVLYWSEYDSEKRIRDFNRPF